MAIKINGTTLKNGSQGSDVKELQKALQGAGYNVGGTGADGVYGKNTAAAVKQYQKDNGLAVDGIAGKNTLTSLFTVSEPVTVTKKATNSKATTAGGTVATQEEIEENSDKDVAATMNPIAAISSSVRGTGFDPGPTNPVTPLVFLTTYHVSSFITIWIRTYPGNIFLDTVLLAPFFISTTSCIGTLTSKI